MKIGSANTIRANTATLPGQAADAERSRFPGSSLMEVDGFAFLPTTGSGEPDRMRAALDAAESG